MPEYENILFDFDGTLFDTSEGVFKSFDYVADFYKITIKDKSVYNTMIGPPLLDSFNRVFGFEGDELTAAMAKYREYYTPYGMFECRLYDGVLDLINSLKNCGKKIFVATSKPEVYANQILEKQGISNLFDFVGGSDLEEAVRIKKSDIINYVLQKNGIKDKSSCIMVGDTKFDILGAKHAGLDSLGILWGFGTRAALTEAGATYLAPTPQAALNLLVC